MIISKTTAHDIRSYCVLGIIEPSSITPSSIEIEKVDQKLESSQIAGCRSDCCMSSAVKGPTDICYRVIPGIPKQVPWFSCAVHRKSSSQANFRVFLYCSPLSCAVCMLPNARQSLCRFRLIGCCFVKPQAGHDRWLSMILDDFRSFSKRCPGTEHPDVMSLHCRSCSHDLLPRLCVWKFPKRLHRWPKLLSLPCSFWASTAAHSARFVASPPLPPPSNPAMRSACLVAVCLLAVVAVASATTHYKEQFDSQTTQQHADSIRSRATLVSAATRAQQQVAGL